MRKIFIFSIILLLGLFLHGFTMAETTNGDITSSDILMPGTVEGTGTHFEVTDSEYLNIVLDSSEAITLRLESVPEMVTIHIEPASETTSTQITIRGFEPSTTYYKYEDDYHNLVEFTTDGNGSYSWTQDLNQVHFVFIQPRKSTKFIKDNSTGGDCTSIGTWDSAIKTCTLTTDVNETIQIDSDYITLDGNGHTINGASTGSGVFLSGRIGVTIKNLNSRNFYYGVFLWDSDNNTLTNNNTSDNREGIFLWASHNNTITNNNTLGNARGISIWYSSNNTITGNTTSSNWYGIWHVNSTDNVFTNNTICNNGCDFDCGGISALTESGNRCNTSCRCPISLSCMPCDTTSPTTFATLSGTSGNNDWYISNVQVTLTATDNEGGSGVKTTEYSFDGSTWNTYLSTFTISNEGTTTVYYRSTDNADNVESQKSIGIKIDKTISTVTTVTATPNTLWPPNHKVVDVTIDGSASDDSSGIESIEISVTDEYGEYNMTVSEFGSTIQLEAWREGTDKDGRVYTITVVATDNAGNQATATTEVTVPHDMRE